ncbi:MAG: hypothetical protein ACR2QF_00385 [Geminicoccaceae bacterium]
MGLPDDIREEVRVKRRKLGVSYHALAKEAGLGKNALESMDHPAWNPRILTIQVIDEALRRIKNRQKAQDKKEIEQYGEAEFG